MSTQPPLPEPITSTRAPRVAAVRRLTRRSARAAERRFVVEGPQAVREALAAGGLLEVFVTAGHDELVQLAGTTGTVVTTVSPAVLLAMAETVAPQGVLGVAQLLDVPLEQALAGSPRLVAVLDRVADPGNAGTVIRTADAAGADAVVLAGDSVDPHNGKCVRSTAGSLWHLPIVSGAPLDAVLALARDRGLQVLATSGGGAEDLEELLADGVLAAPTMWVFGSEAHGLPPGVLAAADRQVRVPMYGRAESLNLASAAAVCLYASARARRVLQ